MFFLFPLMLLCHMGVSKNSGENTQNGWFISWKTLFLETPIFSHIFGNTHIHACSLIRSILDVRCLKQ